MPPIVKRARTRTEGVIQQEIRAWAANQPDVTLFRNNTGMLNDSRGVPVRYGLCVGSADLVGWLRMRVGYHIFARFLAIEVKGAGKHATQDQELWLQMVRDQGGIAGVATSWEEAKELVQEAREWRA